MKKIPASYQLDEQDIKDAITDWLNKHREYDGDDATDFDITLDMKVNTKALGGGMSDWVEVRTFSATASCND